MHPRESGIFLHISSLASPHGIGTFGCEAYRFADFLKSAGQKYWQVLPLGHTGYGDSPYQPFSSFAGNPYFIDLDMLVSDGLLSADEVSAADLGSDPDFADYGLLYHNRLPLLRSAHRKCSSELMGKVRGFAAQNRPWLYDYCLFMSVKEHFGMLPLCRWPDNSIKKRQKKALEYYSLLLADSISFYEFIQYLFFSQWMALKAYVNALGIKIIGDLPIYVSADSADVWANPRLFRLDSLLSPAFAAGVPPDLYSETGQLWGNPVYRYSRHRLSGYAWWLFRVSHSLSLFDAVRIDHFRAFSAYYEIKAGEATAENGRWVRGPGSDLLSKIMRSAPTGAIIPEDLGIIDEKVRALRDAYRLPSMRVLVFGMDDTDSEHFPARYSDNIVAYTSTHDSLPFRAVFESLCPERRADVSSGLGLGESWRLGLSAFCAISATPARLVIAPMQDVLSLGADAVMNRPSVPDGNWRWRVRHEAVNAAVAADLYRIALCAGRVSP